MQKLFDSHVHTSHSFDCDADLGDICKAAGEQKLLGLCITDHWEAGQDKWSSFEEDIRGSVHSAAQMRDRLAGRLLVTVGVELGQPHHNPAEAAHALALYDYDFILLSNHSLCGQPDFCDYLPPRDKVDEVMEQYFIQTLEMIKQFDFDSLAHLTYPIRYLQGRHGIQINWPQHQQGIDRILNELITQNKCLELNTSGLRYFGETLPSGTILNRYYELGGRLVTVGSDAHDAGNVAGQFPDALKMLWDTGFTSYHYYQNRKLVPIPIV